jgi:hypothetical protein
MTADLARLLRRWASLSEEDRFYVLRAIERASGNGPDPAIAQELLEEAARVGAELEGQHARAVAEGVASYARSPAEAHTGLQCVCEVGAYYAKRPCPCDCHGIMNKGLT